MRTVFDIVVAFLFVVVILLILDRIVYFWPEQFAPDPYPTCEKYGYAGHTTIVMNKKTNLLIIQCVEGKTNEKRL